ncbi:MAG: YfhO family protein, partial [Candidatus Obscuribacterales bacterium]|nr:YfhO family protein [Candidatus Obscuribacterales bacterium]
ESSKAKSLSEKYGQSSSSYQRVESFQCPDPNSIKIICDKKSEGYLVLTDVYYPGWQVYVDGEKAEIERANFAFRAVKLSAGKHELRFEYEPLSFRAACILFLLGLISAVFFSLLKNRRSKS